MIKSINAIMIIGINGIRMLTVIIEPTNVNITNNNIDIKNNIKQPICI